MLVNLVKQILKIGNPDILSDVVKTVGLLARATFDKNVGIDNIFLKGVIQNVSLIIREATTDSLLINIIKTVGIFAN